MVFLTGVTGFLGGAFLSQVLESTFDGEVVCLVRAEDDESAEVVKIFKDLSSGHKIVLLTLTRLVEKVEEKTLVLIDEPEAHLGQNDEQRYPGDITDDRMTEHSEYRDPCQDIP